jgi:hypothetical protein
MLASCLLVFRLNARGEKLAYLARNRKLRPPARWQSPARSAKSRVRSANSGGGLPRRPPVWLNAGMGRWFFGFFFYFPRHLAEGNG